METIRYTGSNGAEVKAWFNRMVSGRPEHEAWFMTRGMAASTGLQAWNYALDGEKFHESVKAIFYDGSVWTPLLVGEALGIVKGKVRIVK